MAYYIGLMSGTSADGIDAVLADLDQNKITICDCEFLPYSDDTKSKVQSLQQDRNSSYHQVAQLDIELGGLYANAVTILAERNSQIEIIAIGTHGQTIQHHPNEMPAYTLQIGNAAIITEKTGLTVVNDFRSRDVALGGQGAPFAPAFHKAFFANSKTDRTIVNIGGIANISYLVGDIDVIGFDSGPGNTLIDFICKENFNKNYDHDGEIAQTGIIDQRLLQELLTDSYFSCKPPKSTGQEYFNLDWLANYLDIGSYSLSPTDLIATLTMLTAESIAASISTFCTNTKEIYVCGGGANNKALMNFLNQKTDKDIKTTQALGIHSDWVEACGFAWLAKQAIEKHPIDLTKITGARKTTILGSIWPVV